MSTPDVNDALAIDASVTASTGSAPFGVTDGGFVPKPFARILAEKIALAQALFGDGIDVVSGSALRSMLEISALEDARTWSAAAATFDSLFVASARGAALSALGAELGLPRPFLEASGVIALKLVQPPPAGVTLMSVPIRRGARLSTAGGHHLSVDQDVLLTPDAASRTVPVVAFYPGPEHDLDPSDPNQAIDRWFAPDIDPSIAELAAAERAAGSKIVTIEHTKPLTGGSLQWPDERYRRLLLGAPRSTWTVDAIRVAVSLVPGVRQVLVRDLWGGLDLSQSIFGDFNFIERVFSSERDLGSPYYFTVLVAPHPAAIWDGPDGLYAQVASAIEDLRPIGIFPNIQAADEVSVGFACDLIVKGLPLPGGSRTQVNASAAAVDLKARLFARVRAYVDALGFGEPVRASEVTWALMSEPGIVDVQNLRLVRYPPPASTLDFRLVVEEAPQVLALGENVVLAANQVAVATQDDARVAIT